MAEPTLIIVHGGIVQDVSNIPPGVTVVVRNYDVEPKDDPDYPRDERGDPYSECVWDGGELDHANRDS